MNSFRGQGYLPRGAAYREKLLDMTPEDFPGIRAQRGHAVENVHKNEITSPVLARILQVISNSIFQKII